MLIRLILLPIYLYRYFVSPIIPRACRYYPSCSCYMIEAIKVHGIYGLMLGIKRLLRCNPWSGSGFDPVPDKKN